ncbi:MAG: TrbI/VirB10 family protein [Legionellales bacterium]
MISKIVIKIAAVVVLLVSAGCSETSTSALRSDVVYLPVGTQMTGNLLTGLDVPITSNIRPLPFLIHITGTIAQPNGAKVINVSGCFIVGEVTTSDLASERVYVRLDSLSCLNKEGKVVINHKVKGFVVDTDKKSGLIAKAVRKTHADDLSGNQSIVLEVSPGTGITAVLTKGI